MKKTLVFVLIVFCSIAHGGMVVGWGEDEQIPAMLNIPSDSNFVSISGGAINNLALTEEGSIVAWGQDGYYQQAPSGMGYQNIEGGIGPASLAINSSGGIVGWGDDSYGQLSNIPAGNDYMSISAGGFHCLALTLDGTLVGWGMNYGGALDLPASYKYKAVTAGVDLSVGIKEDGTLAAAGCNYNNGSTAIEVPDGTFMAVAAGFSHYVALAEDGSLYSWSYDWESEFACPEGNDFIAVDAGAGFCMALRENGSIVAWGHYPDDVLDYVPTGDDFTDISAGVNHAFALIPEPCTLSLLACGSLVLWRKRKRRN